MILSKSHIKLYFLFIVVNLIGAVIMYFFNIKYIISYEYGFLSFIILMIVNMKFIHKKIDDSISNAIEMSKSSANEILKNNDESTNEQDFKMTQTAQNSQTQQNQQIAQDSKKEQDDNKKIMRFLDLSHFRLGLEIYFNVYKFLAFIFLAVIFALLVIFDMMYGASVIVGIFISSMTFVFYLFRTLKN